jgi:pyruvate/2-oxoglutarate dehydrogenase complex dihydrolipoamide dehydrogenase (E3) component
MFELESSADTPRENTAVLTDELIACATIQTTSGLGITDEHDFIRVDGMMRVYDLANAYAVGDVVAFSGPKLAHLAVRQAGVLARKSCLNDKK